MDRKETREVYVKARIEVIDVKELNEISALAGTCSNGTSTGGGYPSGICKKR